MNGVDRCPKCGHDMEIQYGDRYHGGRKMSCWWCRMARNEFERRRIGTEIDVLAPLRPSEEQDRVVFDLARQGMERVIRELESEGAWL